MTSKPEIITAKQLGLSFPDYPYDTLGPVTRVTGHYSAGPKDRDAAHMRSLLKLYDAMHAREYDSDGIGYHLAIERRGPNGFGRLYLLRPVDSKGTHVAKNNTGNVGILCMGTTGDKPSIRQRRTLKWLMEGGALTLPKSHRFNPTGVHIKGHLRYGGTLCPGSFIRMYESEGAYR